MTSQLMDAYAGGNDTHPMSLAHRWVLSPNEKTVVTELKSNKFDAFCRAAFDFLNDASVQYLVIGGLAFADIMLPLRTQGHASWRMVEVKSSTSVKDYYRDDTAVQAFVAMGAGVPLDSIAIAHIDREWVYPGAEKYEGLLKERDLTEEAFGRQDEVKTWISESQNVVALADEPGIATGRQCGDPYECGFLEYCGSKEKQAKYPVRGFLACNRASCGHSSRDEASKTCATFPTICSTSGSAGSRRTPSPARCYFDAEGAKSSLQHHEPPAYFLDFETIYFAVPIWNGTRPYQQIPFQFSMHRISQEGELTLKAFLDLSGNDPSRRLAESCQGLRRGRPRCSCTMRPSKPDA